MTGKTENLPKVRKTKNSPKSVTKKGQKRAEIDEKENKNEQKETKITKKRAAAKKIEQKSEEEKQKEARKKLIANEVRRLSATFKDIEGEKKKLVKATIDDAAFLTVMLKELREQINREGTEIEYKNGENQYGKKTSPAVTNYLQMSKQLAVAVKILLDCQPKNDKPQEADDGFNGFIEERGDD